MKGETLFSVGVLFSLSIITVVYFGLIDPEQTAVVSPDQRVSLEGTARQTQMYSITQAEALSAPLAGVPYHLEPAGIVSDRVVKLVFRLDGPEDTRVLYRYQEQQQAWEEVVGVERTAQGLVLHTGLLGTFVLGEHEEVAVPNYVSVMDELRARAPVGTVGYIVNVSYARGNGERIVLYDEEEVGGCDGVFARGVRTEYSEVSKDASVLINDVQTMTHFVYRVEFQVEDGCRAGVEIEPTLGM